MKQTKSTMVALVAAGLLLPGVALNAQQPKMGKGDMQMGPGMMGMMRDCPMMGTSMGAEMATHAEGRIAFLKAELGITDAQKTVWDAYAAALTKNLQDMQAMRVTMKKVMEAKSPVERLDAHLTAMDGRVASLKEVKPTLAALYAALSDDQKKKADQILTGMGCMM
jgi:LTXXQ motif family protein